MRIAAVDDDPAQLDLIHAVVVAMGHDCHAFAQGEDFLHAVNRETFDLLIIDWELPDIEGTAIARKVRAQVTSAIPILMLTNRSDERDIVTGLQCGADDYMVKSKRVMELRARIAALLRRGGHIRATEELNFDRYRFHPTQRSVHLDGVAVVLKHKEFDLALTMFTHLGQLVSRGYLIEALWGKGADVTSRSLDVYFSHVRSKLALRAENGYRLTSVYNHGYRLEKIQPITPDYGPTAFQQSA